MALRRFVKQKYDSIHIIRQIFLSSLPLIRYLFLITAPGFYSGAFFMPLNYTRPGRRFAVLPCRRVAAIPERVYLKKYFKKNFKINSVVSTFMSYL